MIASIINSTGATIIIGAESFAIRKDHVSYPSILEELNGDRDPDKLRSLLDIKTSISTLTEGKVEVKDDKIYVNGEEVNTGLSRRILGFVRDNQNGLAKPLIAFLENLMNNPSRRAVQGLYEWLEKSNLPITEDGCFIAWKIVGPDFMSLYNGNNAEKFDNSPGKTVQVARNQVDEDPDKTCSYGLHFCSDGYLPSYGRAEGNKVVMVKVNPADVVAFPRDYNTAKGRCCKYEVLREVPRENVQGALGGNNLVYRPEVPRSKFEGFYHDSDGYLVGFYADGSERELDVLGNGDYDWQEYGTNTIQLLPSNRIVTV